MNFSAFWKPECCSRPKLKRSLFSHYPVGSHSQPSKQGPSHLIGPDFYHKISLSLDFITLKSHSVGLPKASDSHDSPRLYDMGCKAGGGGGTKQDEIGHGEGWATSRSRGERKAPEGWVPQCRPPSMTFVNTNNHEAKKKKNQTQTNM